MLSMTAVQFLKAELLGRVVQSPISEFRMSEDFDLSFVKLQCRFLNIVWPSVLRLFKSKSVKNICIQRTSIIPVSQYDVKLFFSL